MNAGSTTVFILAVFGASTVEMVEALTIVVAAGVTRGWRSALEGAAAAILVLALVVGLVGVPLIHYVPINALRVVVGTLLLVLGMSWLRKAMLRASGHKALHDEDAIFAKETSELRQGATAVRGQRDGIGFAVAFKGVFLEGTEVVLIVVSLGASDHRLGIAAAAAGAAAVVVAGVGVVVARQLSEVPENLIKMIVGVMLTSFGLFWVGEGAGVHWPGSDLAILALIPLFAATAGATIVWLRRSSPAAGRASGVRPTTNPAIEP
jgi:Ca2+/H+ antiporter, TMEM165/GDT1 family